MSIRSDHFDALRLVITTTATRTNWDGKQAKNWLSAICYEDSSRIMHLLGEVSTGVIDTFFMTSMIVEEIARLLSTTDWKCELITCRNSLSFANCFVQYITFIRAWISPCCWTIWATTGSHSTFFRSDYKSPITWSIEWHYMHRLERYTIIFLHAISWSDQPPKSERIGGNMLESCEELSEMIDSKFYTKKKKMLALIFVIDLI